MPLVLALGIAALHGLRHATDPDHLVATTSLVAADGGSTRDAARLGAWWGVGHAAALLAVGLPLTFINEGLAGWLESGAETAIGLVIVALAARVMWKWARGQIPARGGQHDHRPVRSPQQAFAIGTLHGLAGTGAVVLLLVTALPTQPQAAAALAIFASMSIVSMAACTGAFAWLLTRPPIEPVYRTVLIPALGLFGVMFGAWYAGLA